MFYSYIKGRSKIKDKIQSNIDQGKIVVKDEEICEKIINRYLQKRDLLKQNMYKKWLKL